MIILSLIEVFVMGFYRAASLPRDCGGVYIQMRLSYSPLAPLFLYLIEWMDYSCTDTLPSYLGLLHVLVYKVVLFAYVTISSCCLFTKWSWRASLVGINVYLSIYINFLLLEPSCLKKPKLSLKLLFRHMLMESRQFPRMTGKPP